METSEKIVIGLERFDTGDVAFGVEQVEESQQEWLRGLTSMLIRGLEDIQRDFPDQLVFIQSDANMRGSRHGT